MVANNIMKLNEFEKESYYRFSCACSDPKCDTSMFLEFDEKFGDITLTFYKDMKYCSYWNYGSGIFWESLKYISEKVNIFFGKQEGVFLELITCDFHRTVWDYWKRITGCFRLFFTGKIELEEHVMFSNEDHILGIIDALDQGCEKLRGFKKYGN